MLKSSITFTNNSKSVQEGIGKFIDRAVGRSGRLMELNIKINTPVQHGHLKKSINYRKTGFGSGEVTTIPIVEGVEVDYGVYQEYGTKYQPPRAMFRKGVEQSESRIKEIFAEEAVKVKDVIVNGPKKKL